MGFLDRAKEAAQRAKSQARVAREQGQQRIGDLQARRLAELLLRDVGIAAYEEHRGEGDHEAVVRALARLDRHLSNHPSDLSTGGLRGYMRTAAGTDADADADAESAPGDETSPAEAQDEPAGSGAPADEGSAAGPSDEPPAEPAEPAEPAAKKTAKKATKKSTAKKAAKKTAKKTAKKSAAKKAAKKTAPSEKPQSAE